MKNDFIIDTFVIIWEIGVIDMVFLGHIKSKHINILILVVLVFDYLALLILEFSLFLFIPKTLLVLFHLFQSKIGLLKESIFIIFSIFIFLDLVSKVVNVLKNS